MDNEMINRVAEAIYNDTKSNYILKHTYISHAIAAIKAMREPTEMMLTAKEVYPSCHVCGGHKEGWQNMIDAVIND
jgi:hypothetical protein